MGVFVYARHTSDRAKRADRFWHRCRCPKWLRGTVAGREVRKSAKTRSWAEAEIAAHSIENGDASKARSTRLKSGRANENATTPASGNTRPGAK
jgi:hypothetical protein